MKTRWIIGVMILLVLALAAVAFFKYNEKKATNESDDLAVIEQKDAEQEARFNEAIGIAQEFPPVNDFAQKFKGTIKYSAYQKEDDNPNDIVVEMIKNMGETSYVFRIMVNIKIKDAKIEHNFEELEKVFAIAAKSQSVKQFIGNKKSITYRLVRLPLPDDPDNYIVGVEVNSNNTEQPITEEFRVNIKTLIVDVVDI